MGLTMTTPSIATRSADLARRLKAQADYDRAPQAPRASVSVHPGDGDIVVVSRLPSYAPDDLDIGKPYRVAVIKKAKGAPSFKLYDGDKLVCYQNATFWWHAQWTVRAEG